MPSAAFLLLVAALSPGPACAGDGESFSHRLHHAEINLVRLSNGLAPVSTHPVFCRLAAERAARVAADGSTEVDVPYVTATTARIYRLGYRPHDWAQTALILNPGDAPLTRWREVKPDSYRDSVLGDFQHLGIGLARRGERPVFAVYLALPTRSVEWRQAEPLRDLEWVRREILAEVNRFRAERSLAPLVADERLDLAAQRHAADLLAHAYYSHRGRDGANVRDRVVRAGYPPPPLVAENIAKGPFTPREVVSRWMNSRGHRRNILNPRLRKLGSGVAFGENERGFETLWVQVFAG